MSRHLDLDCSRQSRPSGLIILLIFCLSTFYYPQKATLNTLSDRHDDDSSGGGLLEELEDVDSIGRDVAGAVALQNDALDRRLEEVGQGLAPDGGEESEKHHVRVQGRVNTELENVSQRVINNINYLHMNGLFRKPFS